MTHYIDIEVYLDEHKEDLIDEIDFDDILSELSTNYQSHRVEIGISLCGDLDTYEDHIVDVELDTDDIKSRIENEIMRLTNKADGWQRAYAELKQKLIAIELLESNLYSKLCSGDYK